MDTGAYGRRLCCDGVRRNVGNLWRTDPDVVPIFSRYANKTFRLTVSFAALLQYRRPLVPDHARCISNLSVRLCYRS